MATQKVNLDDKDREILKILCRDTKASVADIARTLGVQRDTVKYRIERLEKRGLIIKYHTILDPHALGLEVFMMVLLKTHPVNREKLDTFIRELQTNAHVTHISRLIGPYDYFLQMAASDIEAFDLALDEVKRVGEGVIAEIELANVIDGLKTDDFSGLV